MTASTPSPSRPPLPHWEAVTDAAQEEARQRQGALLPALERWSHPLVSHAELEQFAADAFSRINGSAVDVRTVRRWIRDVMERDGGRRDWSRPEIFLRRNPPLRPKHRAELSEGEQSFAALFDIITLGFACPGKMSHDEEARFWRVAWEEHQVVIASGTAPKRAKAELLAFILRHAGWLTQGSKNALRMMVARQFQKFSKAQPGVRSAAAAALDGRNAKRGNSTAQPIPADDIEKIIGYALFDCGARLAQAKRQLVRLGPETGISAATLDLLDAGKSKSYVNRRLAQQVQPQLEALAPYRLGKQAIDDATPTLHRDYSDLRSMQIVNADDYTMPVYFYLPDRKGWFELTRGQVLLFIDVRSLKIITWALIPSRNYTALNIRSAMNTVCLEQGRPDVWYFERGIWQRSNLVQGRAPKQWRLAHESQAATEHGWEKLGVRFIHAIRARTKPAELVGGLLQNMMEGCKGYCGRFEREDCPEETKKAKLAVEGRRDHPSKHFYSFDEWHSALGSRILAYNDEVKQGRILDGRSPNQAFEEFWPHDNPPVKFDPSCWHLCAHYMSEQKVSVDGIEFRLGNQRYHYNGDALESFRHRKALAYFDPEHPEILGVTDMAGKNPLFVTRAAMTGFADSISEDADRRNAYGDAVAGQKRQVSLARARYQSIQATFKRTFRKNIVDRDTASLGRELLDKRNEAIEQSTEDTRRRARTMKLARSVGVATATIDLESPETEQALRRRADRRRELENEQAADQGTP